jgi:hypothetical protein
VNPQRDIRPRIVGRERQQLRGQQGAVVVVEDPVEYEYPLAEQLFPRPPAEKWCLLFLSHDTSLRPRPSPPWPPLPTADPLKAEIRPPGEG